MNLLTGAFISALWDISIDYEFPASKRSAGQSDFQPPPVYPCLWIFHSFIDNNFIEWVHGVPETYHE